VVFLIGAFARLSGVSAKMLRAWDALGLFRPIWVDPASGYRWYSPAQLPELRRIVALRDLGVSLAEIADLIAGGADLRAVLARRQADLERMRLEVARRLRALEIEVEGPDDRSADRPRLDVVVRPVASEWVATLTVGPPAGDLGRAFYELEADVRDRGRRASRPPGAMIDDRSGARSAEVFVPLRGPLEPRGSIGCRRLPACRAASIIHRGDYGSLAQARRSLQRWVDAAGLTPSGPLRVIYLQFGAEPELRVPGAFLVERDADFVTELQQPVG
jgi:DNA-binding transcriptional MerR regulator